MKVDLVWFGRHEPPAWELGEVVLAGDQSVGAIVEQHAARTDADALLHWDAVEVPDAAVLNDLLRRTGDVWHAGLSLGMSSLPGILDAVAPTWMFNADAAPNIESTSWRLSLGAALVKTEVVRSLGHLSAGFDSLPGAALELGHRWIQNGALMRHTPLLAVGSRPTEHPSVGIADELRFVRMRYGNRWMFWAAARAFRWGKSPVAVARGAAAARRAQAKTVSVAPYVTRPGAVLDPPTSVTVLIPTLERYPWLEVVLRQLGEQTVAPSEVIVIDQTDPARRRHDLESSFPGIPLRVIQLDRRGQSTARNAGIAASTGEAILFLDDDDEIPPDLIERHIARMAPVDVDASCGVAVEPGDASGSEAGRVFASSVFPTNNTLLRTKALRRSGLFDAAYDHGTRADGDLGMRLYLSGAHLVLDGDNEVLHLRAPAGGLRVYGARKTTRRGSRASYVERNKLNATEVYLARRYFSARQVREMLLMRKVSTLTRAGTSMQRAVRAVVQVVLLPDTISVHKAACRRADELERDFPQIGTLLR